MSQAPTAPGLSATSAPQRSHDSLPAPHDSISRQPSYQAAPSNDSSDTSNVPVPAPAQETQITQSPVQASTQAPAPPERDEMAASRPFGVHSILNPTQSEPRDTSNRQQGLLPSASPASTISSVPHYPLSSIPPSPASVGLIGFPSSPGDGPSRSLQRPPRRMLTPKSPARRVATMHALPPPAATINASEAPFAPARGRRYSPDPSGRRSTDIPPMPTPPGGRFGLPSALGSGATVPVQDRRASGGASQTFHSQSASPSPSHSSYGQYTSPAAPYALPFSQTGPVYSNPPTTAPASLPASTLAAAYGRHGESASIGGASAFQMTLNTESGPMHVPVTVDVQAASRNADEKRKRNAGASARFRARRKEKEKEAAQTIAKLEQDIRDLTEGREYYRNERNFYRDMLSRQTTTPLPPRPASPANNRRQSSTDVQSTSGSTTWQATEERSGVGRNTRRRTSGYQPSFETTGPHVSLAPPIPSQYRPLQAPFPEPRPTAPSGHASTGPTLAPPPLAPLPPRSQSFDPFRTQPYDRSWNPGP